MNELASASNERLRAALLTANVTLERLAAHVGTDVKTVDRWVNLGRTPHARNAHAAAGLLGADPYELWPTLAARHRGTPSAGDELVACYPNRGAVPVELWTEVIREAAGPVDVVTSHGLWLDDAIPGLVKLLTLKAADGYRVRFALPNPAVAQDLGARRAALAEELFAPLADVPGVRLWHHCGTVNDVIRAGDDLLVLTSVDGVLPACCPVLHLRRLGAAPLTGVYLSSLEAVFASCEPFGPVLRRLEVAA
jgi:hypothetical protein